MVHSVNQPFYYSYVNFQSHMLAFHRGLKFEIHNTHHPFLPFAFGRRLHMWHNPPTHVLGDTTLPLKFLNNFSSKTRVLIGSKLVPIQGTSLGGSFLHRKLPARRPLSVSPEAPFPRNDPTRTSCPTTGTSGGR